MPETPPTTPPVAPVPIKPPVPSPASVAVEERILTPDFFKLALGLHFFMLNMSIFNLLPYYLELRGASADLYGQVAGSMGISNVVMLLLLGHRADVWSLKATLSTYFVAAFAGNLVALWAMGQESLYWFFVARMLQGVFMGLGFPLLSGWVVALSPPKRKQAAVAWLGIAGILANSLGPTLGELVLAWQGRPEDPTAYFAVFAMATVFQVISLGFLLSARNVHSHGSGAAKGLGALLKQRDALLLLAVCFIFGGLFGAIMSFSKNYTAWLGLPFVSLLLWAYTVGAIFSRVVIQVVMRHITESSLILLGLLGLGLTFLLLGFVRDYPLLTFTGLLYGLSHGVLYPTLYVRFLDTQPRDEVGRSSTLYQGSFSIGWGLFPLFGGSVVGLTNFPTFFGLLAACAGIGILLYLAAERTPQRRT